MKTKNIIDKIGDNYLIFSGTHRGPVTPVHIQIINRKGNIIFNLEDNFRSKSIELSSIINNQKQHRTILRTPYPFQNNRRYQINILVKKDNFQLTIQGDITNHSPSSTDLLEYIFPSDYKIYFITQLSYHATELEEIIPAVEYRLRQVPSPTSSFNHSPSSSNNNNNNNNNNNKSTNSNSNSIQDFRIRMDQMKQDAKKHMAMKDQLQSKTTNSFKTHHSIKSSSDIFENARMAQLNSIGRSSIPIIASSKSNSIHSNSIHSVSSSNPVIPNINQYQKVEVLNVTHNMNRMQLEFEKMRIKYHNQSDDFKYRQFLENKRVVLVGPAASIIDSDQGSLIESYDIVVRLNKALLFPISTKLQQDIGNRTDILYHCLNLKDSCGGNLTVKMLNDNKIEFISCPYPPVIPFDNDIINFNKYLEQNESIVKTKFHHIDSEYYQNIETKIDCRPNTGVSAILDLLRYPLKELYITGITFLKGGYYDEYRQMSEKQAIEYNQLHDNNHDQSKQLSYIRKVIHSDPRVRTDIFLKKLIHTQKCIFIIVDFWLFPINTGSAIRTVNVIHALRSNDFRVILVSTVLIKDNQREFLKRITDDYIEIKVPNKYRFSKSIHPEFDEKIQYYINFYQPIAVLVEYIWMSYTLPSFPYQTIKIIDTHDCLSNRYKIFQQQNIPFRHVTREDEIFHLNKADIIMAIQPKEKETFQEMVPRKTIIYTGFYDYGYTKNLAFSQKPNIKPQPLQEYNSIPSSTDIPIPTSPCSSQNPIVLIYGTNSKVNKLSFEYFIDNCWKRVIKQHPTVVLHIYGTIELSPHYMIHSNRIVSKGFVHDLGEIMRSVTLVVNPTLVQTGVSTRNVISLQHGVALVTTKNATIDLLPVTSSNSLSIPMNPNKYLEVCEDINSMFTPIMNLLTNKEYRLTLMQNAKQFWLDREKQVSIEMIDQLRNHLSFKLDKLRRSIRDDRLSIKNSIRSMYNYFRNEECYILSCGPSLNQYHPNYLREKLSNKLVISIKQAFTSFPDITDFHLTNFCNYQSYDYSKHHPITIFSGPSMEVVSKNKSYKSKVHLIREMLSSDIKLWQDPKYKGNLRERLCLKHNYDDFLFTNNLDRPWGPGIMQELAIYLAIHLGVSKIKILGWDLLDHSGTYRHYDEEQRQQDTEKGTILKNTSSEDSILRELKLVINSTKSLYEWLKSQNVELEILSSMSSVDSIIPRTTL